MQGYLCCVLECHQLTFPCCCHVQVPPAPMAAQRAPQDQLVRCA